MIYAEKENEGESYTQQLSLEEAILKRYNWRFKKFKIFFKIKSDMRVTFWLQQKWQNCSKRKNCSKLIFIILMSFLQFFIDTYADLDKKTKEVDLILNLLLD